MCTHGTFFPGMVQSYDCYGFYGSSSNSNGDHKSIELNLTTLPSSHFVEHVPSKRLKSNSLCENYKPTCLRTLMYCVQTLVV